MRNVLKITMCVIMLIILVTQFGDEPLEASTAGTVITSSTTISSSINEDVYIQTEQNGVADEIVITISEGTTLKKIFISCYWEEGDKITIINNGRLECSIDVAEGVCLINNNYIESFACIYGGKVVLDTDNPTSVSFSNGGTLEVLNNSDVYALAFWSEREVEIIDGGYGIKVLNIITVDVPVPEGLKIKASDYTSFNNQYDLEVEYTDGNVYTIKAGAEYKTFMELFPTVCDKEAPVIKDVQYSGMAMSDNFELVITDVTLASVKIDSVEQTVNGNEFRKVLTSENGVREYRIEAEDERGNKTDVVILVLANWVETTGVPPLDTQIYLSDKYLYVNYDGKWSVEGDDTIYSYDIGYGVVESGYYTFHKE